MREVRFIVPDARNSEIRQRVADEVASLDPADEEDAMRWIEAVTAGEDWADDDKHEPR